MTNRCSRSEFEQFFQTPYFFLEGGNFKSLARISSSGWCASGSGTYLSLDLQKEYHITQAVVMADKEQTKWSSSYLMKYSHDTSYENTEQVLKVLMMKLRFTLQDIL